MNNNRPPIVLIIDGEIGAGKSTLLDSLDNFLPSINEMEKVVIIKEPVETWKNDGHLKEFYADKERNAYEFQTYAFITRIKSIKEAFKKTPDADIYIIERSIFTDRYVFVEMLHDEGFIDNRRYNMYIEWWNLWTDVMPIMPTGFVYLKPSLEECMKRIINRNRDGESGIPMKYQELLREKHEEFFGDKFVNVKGKLVPVLPLETNDNFRDDPEIAIAIAKRIAKFARSTVSK